MAACGLRVRAPAKLNVGLRILGPRPDGYHEIETVFVPLDLEDELEIELDARAGGEPPVTLAVEGPLAGAVPAGEANLAARAAAAALAEAGLGDLAVRLRLRKRIPVAAGLGGGSSDAGAVLRALGPRLGLAPPRLAAIASELGADVPYFLDPRPALGRGRGDVLEALADWPETWWVLLVAPFEVSTPWAYAAAARLRRAAPGSSIAPPGAAPGSSGEVRNDLEPAVAARHPEVRAAVRALLEAGALAAGMSGSGPTCYGRAASAGDAERIVGRLRPPPGWRARVARTPGAEERERRWGVAKR